MRDGIVTRGEESRGDGGILIRKESRGRGDERLPGEEKQLKPSRGIAT
jgi:hypothetical protein